MLIPKSKTIKNGEKKSRLWYMRHHIYSVITTPLGVVFESRSTT